ncbi:hypothetical protein [Clostridium isatidis]|uniref:VCBS repeat-containing protein n=1 Tax=Clostridium isatidis TaxID=182773 RepID=A0A343JE15_9CLOT|nr:hypothetical protein [Clostridium isatidis]ASW43773.1 hypothetical protein BEN51_09845 [Clostridium isatidis]NLZ35457.1 hypothetical protein [Clostridiales bacterium]
MTKLIIIKKKDVLYYILAVLLLLTLLFMISLYFNNNNHMIEDAINVFTPINTKNHSDFDLTGDGINDEVEITKENNKYLVNIKSNNKEYSLINKEGSRYLGDCVNKWPIKIEVFDLSRDNIPEIIVRTSVDNLPINYIFNWNGETFTNILTTNDNLVGILDSTNNKSSKFFSLSSKKGDSSSKGFILLDDQLKDISFSNTKIPALSHIQKFIDIIEAPYDLLTPPDIFSSDINSSELAILWNLNKDNYRYAFQNGYFMDYEWNKEGEVHSLSWLLSFEEVNHKDDTVIPKELLIYLDIKKDQYNNYKIYSIQKL